jgi:hypothetical protein
MNLGLMFGGCTLATPGAEKLSLIELQQDLATTISVGYFGKTHQLLPLNDGRWNQSVMSSPFRVQVSAYLVARMRLVRWLAPRSLFGPLTM